MPKIINQDLIAQIAEFAERGYSKAAAGRELKLDRATVGKHWPEEKEESEVKATPLFPLVRGRCKTINHPGKTSRFLFW